MSYIMIQPLLDKIANGEAAEASLEELTAAGASLIQVGAKIRQTLAVVAIDARAFFDNDFDWVAWVDETLKPSNRADRCHLIDVGKLLSSLRNDGRYIMIQCYKDIFALDFFKLLSLCRIAKRRKLDEIPAFLSHTPGYAKIKREKFRDAVAAWLGEQPDAASEQPLLPGFDDALDTFAGVDSQALRKAVADPETAQRSLRAGLGLFGAAINYELEQSAPDVMTLQTIRAALIAEAQKIENRLAEFGE